MEVVVAHDDLLAIAGLAARSPTIQAFIHAIGLHLSHPPLSVERIFVGLQTLHPAFRARTYLWKRQNPEIRIVECRAGMAR